MMLPLGLELLIVEIMFLAVGQLVYEFQVSLVPGFPSMEGKFPRKKRKWPYEIFRETESLTKVFVNSFPDN